MFGINPVDMAKKELRKVDLNKNGVPDAIEALDGCEAGLNFLAGMIDDIDADDAEKLLKLLNGCLKEEKRRSDAQIKQAAAELVKVPAALRSAAAALESVEKELK